MDLWGGLKASVGERKNTGQRTKRKKKNRKKSVKSGKAITGMLKQFSLVVGESCLLPQQTLVFMMHFEQQ